MRGKMRHSIPLREPFRTTLSSGFNWSSYWTYQSEILFFGFYSEISGGHMPNKVIGATDYLTVAGTAGSETYQCPNTAPYIAADTDYIWFKTDTTQRTTTTAELIGYDLPRTPVKYDNATPYQIRWIMILKAGETLSATKINNLHQSFDLPLYWSGVLNVYGVVKGNRGLIQQLWTPENVYEEETLALIARFTGSPTVATKDLYNKLILDLKTAGTWTKRDAIVMYCGFDAQAALLNLKANAFNHTLAGTTPPTITVGEYIQGDGTSGYIRSNFIPDTNGVTFLQDDNSWGFRVMNAISTDIVAAGARSITPSNYNYIRIRTVDTSRYWNNTNNLIGIFTSGDGIGDFVLERIDSSNQRILKDGVENHADDDASAANINKELFIGAYNLNGNPSGFNTYQYAYYRAGGKLTNTEHLAEHTALEYFRTHILATL